jgi:hypothetical protein
VWSADYGTTGDDLAVAVAVHGQNVYVTGNASGSPYSHWATIRYTNDMFRPGRDGWQFDNSEPNMWPQSWWSKFNYSSSPYPISWSFPPVNATSADFPDWELFADVFGNDQCYIPAGNGLYYYNPKAVLTWRCMVEGNKTRNSAGNVVAHWGGSCYGFSLSALRYYNARLFLGSTVGDYSNVYAVPNDDLSRYMVNKHQVMFQGKPHVDYYTTAQTGSQVFASLKSMLDENFLNDRVLVLYNRTGAGGHAVVACSVYTASPGFSGVTIYDPNYPGEYRFLSYYEPDGEWYSIDYPWGVLGVHLMDPVASYSQTPILPVAPGMAAVPAAASLGLLETFNSPYADIRISNAAGQTVGFASGAMIDSIPGAWRRLTLSGNSSPPIGYFLPPGDYTVRVGASLDSTTYFAAFFDSLAFSFHRQGAKPGDIEVLHLASTERSLTVVNPDTGSKPLFLQSIETVSGEETACRLHVPAMDGGDTLGLHLAGARTVSVLTSKHPTTVDLRLELVKNFANPVFEHAGLSLQQNASYLIAPVWDSLATVPLRIYVDLGKDGTVDDTLYVLNQSTAVPRNERGEIPNQFKLHQNYPNPFNPITTIRYELPHASRVTLKVYNTLGQEVATLVNETKPAGVYTAQFDAANFASGVYLYRLQAGSYVETKKLILLK